jgi:hypothetical protein
MNAKPSDEKLPSITKGKILLLFTAQNYDNAIQKLVVYCGMNSLYIYTYRHTYMHIVNSD